MIQAARESALRWQGLRAKTAALPFGKAAVQKRNHARELEGKPAASRARSSPFLELNRKIS
jgi:hypothetical protein